jgi:type VI secretion system protein ImpA
MSVPDLEALLKPISDDSPCGADLEYAPEFLGLQELARGKPAQEIGDTVRAAQDPPWPKVREAAAALLNNTKDLRVAGVLHHALMRTSGVPGFSFGMALVSGLLERYWEHLHPMLDAEDDNDPTFRVNALVTAMAGEDALASLRTLPLVQSRQFGPHSLRSVRIASGVLNVAPVAGESIDPAQELSKLEAAVADVGVDALRTAAEHIRSAMAALNAIQKVMLDRADGIPAEIGELHSELKEIQAFYASQLTRLGAGDGAAAVDAQGNEPDPAGQSGAAAVNGEIRTRADVVRSIDRICEYYRLVEPSSPIPLLLKRAQRLVEKDFMTILRDLTPAGVSEAEVFTGRESSD